MVLVFGKERRIKSGACFKVQTAAGESQLSFSGFTVALSLDALILSRAFYPCSSFPRLESRLNCLISSSMIIVHKALSQREKKTEKDTGTWFFLGMAYPILSYKPRHFRPCLAPALITGTTGLCPLSPSSLVLQVHHAQWRPAELKSHTRH